ncbi:MAG TPA: metallophosphoesterase [Saprospiraceae bacterium]|nr:metallophosphoesterase [Saprospiraceae bacterium]
MRIIIFLSIILLTLGGGGWYVYNRLSSAFPGSFVQNKIFIAGFIFVLFSFILGKTLEYNKLYFLSDPLLKFGAYSLGFMFYGFLAVVLVDLFRVIHFFVPVLPTFLRENSTQIRLVIGISVIALVTLTVVYGAWNARYLRVKKLELKVNKKVEGIDTLHIVAVSDVHLGNMTGHGKLGKLINRMNSLKPDIVLIAGDIVDDNIDFVKRSRLLERFRELKPKFGVYAVMGNHEYIGRAHNDLSYFKENDIRMLIDQTELIDEKFYLVGRNDINTERMALSSRKKLNELMVGIDKSKPVLLLDHQPYHLEEAVKNGVDLQISGHTHHGQMWPLSWITKAIFELDWGYLQKKDTHFYVSSGFGTAGPPIKVGSHSELVDIRLVFQSGK